MTTAREIVSHFKQVELAKMLQTKQPAISKAVSNNQFPASWYLIIKKIGKDVGIDVPDELFRMKGSTHVGNSD